MTSLLQFLEVEWPFLLCILEVGLCVAAAIAVVVKFEARPSTKRIDSSGNGGDAAALASIQLFRCSSGVLHPAWLAGIRAISFIYLLSIWIISFVASGPLSLVFYTQWTFTLLVIYFGLASYISITKLVSGAAKEKKIVLVDESLGDEETGNFIEQESIADTTEDETDASAGFIGYATLVIFQTATAASVLTDTVYWFILVPYVLASPFFDLNFVNLNMHGVNAIFLLAELFLNDLPFPWFRGAYFVFWTAAYVVFQWFIHGTRLLTWWPYPFLEVSTHYAPAWYFGLAFAHLICFLICLALARTKQPVISYFVSRSARQK
ncbi:uncharacterized protein LOC9658719 [Selaginella moellendorffii]|nr:uncharacterized protein LOC9658719 [Selaginella moellendorffii]|eukprot:XP_002986467.2 uncharacterized protein LOC9658719 [Selaginella moellendorffii]